MYNNRGSRTNLPADLQLHAMQQRDNKMLEIPHLGQKLSPNKEGGVSPFSSQVEVLTFNLAALHSSTNYLCVYQRDCGVSEEQVTKYCVQSLPAS